MKLEKVFKVIGFPFRHPRATLATIGAAGLLGVAGYNLKESEPINNPSMIASPFQYVEQKYNFHRDKNVGMAYLTGAIIVAGMYAKYKPKKKQKENEREERDREREQVIDKIKDIKIKSGTIGS